MVTTKSIKSVSFCSFLPNAKELGREDSEWWSEKYDDCYGTKIAMTLKKKKQKQKQKQTNKQKQNRSIHFNDGYLQNPQCNMYLLRKKFFYIYEYFFWFFILRQIKCLFVLTFPGNAAYCSPTQMVQCFHNESCKCFHSLFDIFFFNCCGTTLNKRTSLLPKPFPFFFISSSFL